jgi:excisionase family DNA binding protein
MSATTTEGPIKPIMTVADVAALFGVGEKAVYKWIAQEKLRPAAIMRVGRAIYVKGPELERWIAEGGTA